jgi:PhnB protein
MSFEMFINFDGNCREAVEFYAKAFQSQVSNLMTYGDAPADPANPPVPGNEDRILYAGVSVGDIVLMFCDCPVGSPFIQGNNIYPVLNYQDKDEVTRVYNALLEGGTARMQLGKTFFSELFAMVEDKFGICWQISYYVPPDVS